MPAARRKSSPGITRAQARRLVLSLDGVTEGRSYGMPSFLLEGRFFARFRDSDTVLVLQLGSIDDRDVLLQLDPEAFFFTDHYRDYPAVLIRLSAITRPKLAEVLRLAWEDATRPRAQRRRRRRS